MSTQSERINSIQTSTATFRHLLMGMDPVPAYTDWQKHDRAEIAARDVAQLGVMFDAILGEYIARVEDVCGPLSPAWRAEIKDCFAGLMSDVVSPAFKDLATRLGEEIEYRDPYASERLTPQTQGVETGRRAA